MKRILYAVLLALLFPLFLNSCEENEMIQYGDGGEIDFMGDYYEGKYKKPYWVDDVKYLKYEKNFGINKLGDSLMYDTLQLAVKIMGTKTDRPRRVVLTTQGPKENALEVIFPEDYYIPADTGRVVLKVVVKRPATRNVTYSTKLVFDYARSDFKPGTAERQAFELKATDEVSMKLWGVTEEEWYAEEGINFYLGEYSETKARFIITLLGVTKFNEWYGSDDFFNVLMENTLYFALEEYKSNQDNPPLLDEKGQEIEFPNIYELM